MTEQLPPNPEPPTAEPPTAEAPTPAPAPPQPSAAWPGAAWPGPYGDPFVAPPRPRVRWINPQRRVHVAGAGLVLALVCGGAGVAIGWAASDHHDRGPIGVRLAPGYYGRYGPGPGRMGPNRLPRPAAPAPTPSSTH